MSSRISVRPSVCPSRSGIPWKRIDPLTDTLNPQTNGPLYSNIYNNNNNNHRLTIWSTQAIIVPHRITLSWYTGRNRWVGCYIWYSEEEPERAEALPSPLLAVPNVTAHP